MEDREEQGVLEVLAHGGVVTVQREVSVQYHHYQEVHEESVRQIAGN